MRNIRHKNIRFITGIVIMSVMLLLALISIFHTPYPINGISSDERLLDPSFRHIFGTDNLGRDVFSRTMVGIRTSLLAATGIVAIGAFFGLIIGALTGYFGGIADEIIMRINDGLASFPSILLAMVCVAVFGAGTLTVVFVLGVLFIPSFARVVRSEYIREKEKDYVKNIRLHGATAPRIMFRHILPNITESFFSAIAIGINNAILAESGLSYLGLGVQPPTPSLGRMMSEGQTYILKAGWICIYPGLMIMLIVMATSLISESFTRNIRSEFTFFQTKRMREFLEAQRAEGAAGKKPEETGKENPGDTRKEIPEETGEKTETDKKPVILRVENLRIAVDPDNIHEIVHGISFSINEGESLGFVGESGSGKSMSSLSIMNLLNGRGEMTADLVEFKGRTIIKDGKKLLSEKEYALLRGSDLAMVFQEPMTALDPSKKIGRLLSEAIKLKKDITGIREKEEINKRIEKALLDAGLNETERIKNSYPHELSGGQRQRVLIAMSLINDPELLILDEPTTALDAEVAEKILELIRREHRERKLSVIFISHDIEITKSLCSRIMVLKDGVIVECGETGQITENPQKDYTKELIAAGAGRDYMRLREKAFGNSRKLSRIPENILIAKKVSVSYKGRKKSENKVIDNLSFYIRKGECFGISGESGSGKTTLVKAMCGLLPYSGSIETKARYSMVFQDPYSSLNPAMKVGQLLEEVLYVSERTGRKELHKDLILQALSDTGLSAEYLDRYPSELSGGQRQRVAIAMAIITRPELVFLDEPVTALDVTIQDKIMLLLNDLMLKYGLTYVMISHDRRLLENMCDRVMKLNVSEKE